MNLSGRVEIKMWLFENGEELNLKKKKMFKLFNRVTKVLKGAKTLRFTSLVTVFEERAAKVENLEFSQRHNVPKN